MDRLFLDANVLFSAAYRANAGLARFWKLSKVVLLSSLYALEEARANLSEEAQKKRLEVLAKSLQLVEAVSQGLPPSILLPEKDNPILLAAIAGQATHLLTGDLRHFGPYFGKTIQGVLIASPAMYLQTRQKQ